MEIKNTSNKLKICLVGPGYMPIPPKGWGAVESLIWDYKESLSELGHSVNIVNTVNQREIINKVNNLNPDLVHIHYDDWIGVADHLKCDKIIATSHFAYLEQPKKRNGYEGIFKKFCNNKRINIFALSEGIKNQYIKNGFSKDRVFVIPNGVSNEKFKKQLKCKFEDRSIYLAKIDYRKRQHLFKSIEGLYFAGNIADSRFPKNHSRWLGEWNKQELYENLTDYANLVLLSDGEAHPLVCMEAMSAGLGLVISEYATANINIELPFIDVIPESEIKNKQYIEQTINSNRKKSIKMREEIIEYSKSFSWNNIVKNYYIPTVNKLF